MTYEETDGRSRRCSRGRYRQDGRHCGMLRRARRAARRRTRLYRDTDEAMLAGVCAGIARHLNLRPRTVRIATVIALILFTVPTLVAYCLIAWLAPTRAERHEDGRAEYSADGDSADDGESKLNAGGSAEGLARLKSRFRRLEEKFADVEAQMMGDR